MSEQRGERPANQRKPGLIDVIKSVGAAFFGVQSEANRRRDFSHGKLHHYVLVGLMATVLFVLVLAGIVALIVSRAGV